MIQRISQRKFRRSTRAIMRRVEAGESFLMSHNSQTIASLRPVEKPYFVDTEVLLAAFAHAPKISYQDLRRDLDAVADQSLM